MAMYVLLVMTIYYMHLRIYSITSTLIVAIILLLCILGYCFTRVFANLLRQMYSTYVSGGDPFCLMRKKYGKLP